MWRKSDLSLVPYLLVAEKNIEGRETLMKLVRITMGFCPCCKKHTVFIATDYYLRENYICVFCRSTPRNRALVKTLKEFYPEYRGLKIHESSPSGSTLRQLKREVKQYSWSYFYEGKASGERLPGGGYNENLENLSFKDESFDIFITQDVLEHINEPAKAFSEISRVLRPGGMHIFTTPISPFQKTKSRISIQDGEIINVLPPVYHGNPIDKNGSLVTYDWGNDILEYIEKSSGMRSKIISFQNSKENYGNGIEGDCLQVIVSKKR